MDRASLKRGSFSGRGSGSGCGIGPQWNGKKLTLHVDHRDGDWTNCQQENLRFLCPNCHSQEETSTNSKTYIVHTCKRCCTNFRSRVNSKGVPDHDFCSSRCGGSVATQTEKGTWPTSEKLKKLVWSSPVEIVAVTIGVSGSAVKKRCRRLGIQTPPRGYWSKSR